MSLELNTRILLELVTLGMPEPLGADLGMRQGTRLNPAVTIQAKTAADVAEWAQRFEVGVTVAERDHSGITVEASFPIEGEWVQVWHRPAYGLIAELLTRRGVLSIQLDLSEPIEVDPEVFLPAAVA